MVMGEVATASGIDFETRCQQIRAHIPLFAIRRKAAQANQMIVDGKPKDTWLWDPGPTATGYRYRFITKERVEDGTTSPRQGAGLEPAVKHRKSQVPTSPGT